MNIKNNSNNSNNWLKMYFNDKYVKQAKQKKIRSRAWFKLDEIQKKDRIFYPGMIVIDLGAAPGSWSEYAITQVGLSGKVIACDILPINPITGVSFVQGDIRNNLVFETLLKELNNNKAQIIMSDMSPNICGISAIDIPNAIYLNRLALNMCRSGLKINGSFVLKIFQGDGFKEYLSSINQFFKKVKIRKPLASRSYSKEVYIVATGWKYN